MQADGLVLRDIHPAPAPPWWPPAPGWWVVAGIVLALLALAIAWWLHRRLRRRRAERMFDAAMRAADSPVRQVAAMSELLRRAARRRDPQADALRGEGWLQFLDAGSEEPSFAGSNGRLLVEGGFRRDVDAGAVAALRQASRKRFIEWMTTRG
jgi:HAMP domain-containing protein